MRAMGKESREHHEASSGKIEKSSKSKEPMKARATAFLVAHPILTTIGLTVFVFLALVALLWYTVFSGLASSADFIYSNF